MGRYAVMMMAMAVEDRPLHFVRGFAMRCRRCSAVFLVAREMADDVLHHHHGAIDHHAEIQRAQREQIGGNVLQVEADGREQQREGNGERDDERAAHVAEEEKQDDRDQDHALGQVVQHGVGGEVQQVAAVDEGNDLDALGQNLIVQLLHLLVNAVERGLRVGALLQAQDAGDHVVVVDERAVFVDGRRRQTGPGGSSGPASTTPMSLTRIGVPPLVVMTVFPMS